MYVRLQREVAERKQAQIEIQNREVYFKTLIENAPDVIMILNPDFTPSYVSPSYERNFGFSMEELLNSPRLAYLHHDDHEMLMKKMEDALQNPGKAYVLDTRAMHKNGEWRWVQAFGSNQLDDRVVSACTVRSTSARYHGHEAGRNHHARVQQHIGARGGGADAGTPEEDGRPQACD